jgi:hypothetical protein
MIGYGDMVFRTLFGLSRARFSATAIAVSENKCFPTGATRAIGPLPS